MKKVYLIIVTYNAMKWAERCFTSLRNSSVPVKCIAVDNGSTDGTQEYIQKNFPEVDFIQSEENLGFGRANNIGIEKAYKAGADFFYLMNQDAWIYPDTVTRLLGFYKSYCNPPEIGILSPIHLDGSEKNIEIFIEKYLAQNALKERIFSDLILLQQKAAYEIDFINAAHWFLPKETVKTVGGFNPYFFHYGEDNEYVNRLKFKNKKTFLVKDCYAVHDGNQDLQKIDYNKFLDTAIDTKILDPQRKNGENEEISSLRKSIAKNMLTGNLQEAKKLNKLLSRIKSNLPELLKSREILMESPHPFLNI